MLRCGEWQTESEAPALNAQDAQPLALAYPAAVRREPLSKACSKCKVTKPAAEFFKDKSKPDGMYSQVRSLAFLGAIPEINLCICCSA